jgi:hypothetical protein
MPGLWINDPETPEGKYLVLRRDGSGPKWPHFVLGGKDPAAPAALRAYARACHNLGYDHAYVRDIHKLAWQFEGYQALNGNTWSYPTPDSQPPDGVRHRVDDPRILALMRHEQTFDEIARPIEVAASSQPEKSLSVNEEEQTNVGNLSFKTVLEWIKKRRAKYEYCCALVSDGERSLQRLNERLVTLQAMQKLARSAQGNGFPTVNETLPEMERNVENLRTAVNQSRQERDQAFARLVELTIPLIGLVPGPSDVQYYLLAKDEVANDSIMLP